TNMNRFIMPHLLRAVVADLGGFVVVDDVVLVTFGVNKISLFSFLLLKRKVRLEN
ncbi:hypothetical protein EDC44_1501, partial [Cricetibacter osteomyelitidis]